MHDNAFGRLKHYAGDVTYDVTDFVKKNVDSLSRDLSLVMYRCELPIMKALFPEGMNTTDDSDGV